jgi:uncharacterized protein YceH (UPF0502 family)
MSLELSFAERRVLGALIEKGFTTPEQYPLSLNSVVAAANQKSCRDPVSSIDEDAALETLESLRRKGFATLVRSEGSRVDRWKHRFSETLELAPKETAVIAELLLRGPQTDGEIRQRASRMAPIDTLEDLARILEGLRSRPEPLVERITPEGRKRGVKYAHGFYPPCERPHDDGPAGPEEAGYPPPARGDSGAWREAPSAPAAAEPAWSAPARQTVALAPPPGDLLEIQKEIRSLKERVEELEATFVKFLR